MGKKPIPKSSKAGQPKKRPKPSGISALEQALLDTSNSNIAILDAHGCILAVNKAWLNFGKTNSPTPGKLPNGIAPGTNYLNILAQTTGPDEVHARKALKAIQQVLSGKKQTATLEYPCYTRHEQLWFNMVVTRLHGKANRLIISHQDITVRKQLEQSRNELDQLVETNPSGFASYRQHPDQSIDMPFVSKRWEEILELKAKDVRKDATPFMLRTHPDDFARLESAVHEARRTQTDLRIEYRIVTPKKGVRWVEVYATPRMEPDGTSVFRGAVTDITDRKQAEATLLEKLELEQRMSKIVQIAPGAFYSFTSQPDGTARLIYASPKFEDLIGDQFPRLKSDFWQVFNVTPAEDIEGLKASVEIAVRQNTTWHQELRIKQPDGQFMWMEGWAQPSREPDGSVTWFGVLMEITHRKRAEEVRKRIEEELIQSENNYRTLAENIEAPVATADADGAFLFVNRRFAEIFGMTPEQMIGGTYFDAIPHERAVLRKKIISQVLSSLEPFTDEAMNVIKGEKRWFIRTTRPLFIHGKPQQVLITAYDITEQRKEQEMQLRYTQELEQQVANRTRELEEALSKERELTELKSKFVSTTSHEFRTPLSTIALTAGLIRRHKARLDVAVMDAKLQTIEKQVHHMSSLLDDVLMIGRIEAGKLDVQLTRVPLQPFVMELVQEVETDRHTHQIDCVFNCEHETIVTDEKLMRHILINLLSNAVKFSPGQARVSFRIGYHNNHFEMTIEDQGIGIPVEDQAYLFQPFHRGGNATTIQGTGLGLSIVKNAVDLLGGSITFVSEPGKGTTFKVSLPQNHV